MPNIVGAIINSFSMDCVMESSLSDSSRIGMGLSKILSVGLLVSDACDRGAAANSNRGTIRVFYNLLRIVGRKKV
jgi:hypothetical protein